MAGILIGYARVSTEDQDLRLQMDALGEAGISPKRVFSDKAGGGRGTKRPGLAAALRACRKGDTICVWKLDRLGRDLAELIDTVRKLDAKGAHLRILTGLALDTRTAGGRFIFHVFGALAEFERELIRERTMAGLMAARARGRVGGRKRTVTPEQEAQAIAMLKRGQPAAVVAKAIGVSPSLIYTRARGEWSGRLAEGTAK